MERYQTITVCAFIYKNGKLLTAKRASSKNFMPDKFELLGGHVEFGETPEEALKRELMEEVQLKITVENPFYAFTYLTDNDKDHCIEVDYFARIDPEDQEIKLNPTEHSEYKWITENETSKYFGDNGEVKKAVDIGFEILNKINR